MSDLYFHADEQEPFTVGLGPGQFAAVTDIGQNAYMRRRFWWWLVTTSAVGVCSAALGVWGVHRQLMARDCLDNGLGLPDWSGTTMVAEGCVLSTPTGEVLVPLHGPSFVGTLAALTSTVLAVALFTTMLIMRTRAR